MGFEINKVYNEDCLETMKKMPKDFIDLVVCSPPYDEAREYNGFSFDFEPIAEELFRVVKEGGVIVWVVADTVKDFSESLTSFKQAIYFREIGFCLFDTMVWRKPNPFHFGSNESYIQSFEYMFVFSKGKPKTINLIYDRKNQTAGSKFLKQDRHSGDYIVYDKHKREGTVAEMGRRHNVWDYPTADGKGLHPAVFPEALVRDHIISWSKEGDLVYDPFLGSGTTAKVAQILGRKWIGSEISEEYCKVALDKLEGSTPLF